MPKGIPPLALFTSLARDKRLFERFMVGGLLDAGNLTLRKREIVIDRITALSGSPCVRGLTRGRLEQLRQRTPLNRLGLMRIEYS